MNSIPLPYSDSGPAEGEKGGGRREERGKSQAPSLPIQLFGRPGFRVGSLSAGVEPQLVAESGLCQEAGPERALLHGSCPLSSLGDPAAALRWRIREGERPGIWRWSWRFSSSRS